MDMAVVSDGTGHPKMPTQNGGSTTEPPNLGVVPSILKQLVASCLFYSCSVGKLGISWMKDPQPHRPFLSTVPLLGVGWLRC